MYVCQVKVSVCRMFEATLIQALFYSAWIRGRIALRLRILPYPDGHSLFVLAMTLKIEYDLF